ncbi:hypothetical protein VTI74DRAFT_9784 [Chaetomium olivicolor]
MPPFNLVGADINEPTAFWTRASHGKSIDLPTTYSQAGPKGVWQDETTATSTRANIASLWMREGKRIPAIWLSMLNFPPRRRRCSRMGGRRADRIDTMSSYVTCAMTEGGKRRAREHRMRAEAST